MGSYFKFVMTFQDLYVTPLRKMKDKVRDKKGSSGKKRHLINSLFKMLKGKLVINLNNPFIRSLKETCISWYGEFDFLVQSRFIMKGYL